ncbi:DUF3040 domain-containing protein [uncultured Varibaculum sp.]|uniref:DUF3040 domain-containing protein n=1 Tax=uncultured Varibaculum sp. TaxID=413896 RepID=UPI00258FF6E5|nr:DUF3040 domain-containing protein [uncultured Varibaculum sp.]
MGLSEKEKQILADMERQFSDVRVAEAPVAKSSEPEKPQKLNFSPKLIAAMTLLILVGIALLIVGISVWTISKFLAVAVAVVGFIVVLFAVTLPMNSRFSSFGVNPNKAVTKNRSSNQGSRRSFKQRQEDRWDRRNGER